MYVSAKELHREFNPGNSSMRQAILWYDRQRKPSLYTVAKRLRKIKQAILDRDYDASVHDCDDADYTSVTKWLRPWDVVPKLKNFWPEADDFGVGVEIEYGFRSEEDAQWIANKVQHWKYITLDYEGGDFPIEATFPPVAYSKLSSRSQALRYCKLLTQESRRTETHTPNDCVGTHVNVSKGSGVMASATLHNRVHSMSVVLCDLDATELRKYFGRIPYGYGYVRGTSNGRIFIEWKLFNSTSEAATLKRYINIAVALTDLVYSSRDLTRENVMIALEYGYNRGKFGKWNSLYTTTTTSA